MNATTRWFKYDAVFSPPLGEWCLWTMRFVPGEKRHYFGGALFESEGKVLVEFDELGHFEPNDTLYFARVLPLEVSDEKSAPR